jgi:glutamate-ammonia-ligase adenylyltransferase
MVAEIAEMRERLEASRSERDVKRGFGGIVDIEFLVQLLQLKYGGRVAGVRVTNTWNALAALHQHGLLSKSEYRALRASYDFLREVESRLRIVHNRSLDELPETPEDLEKLGRRLGFEPGRAGQKFLSELERHTTQTRELFLRVVERER